jgi:hypothetical protein
LTDNVFGWQGIWKIKVTDKNTREVLEETEIKNRIMNQALDELLKVLQGGSSDMNVAYMALGTSNTPLTNTQTELGAEIFRTPPISQNKTGVGELTTVFTVLDNEAVAQIEEIGIFGGSTATASADSGIMISRILWSRNKTANEEIQFSRIDRLVRG